MNSILSYLCINFLLIILDADALKLIPGDRSVVKKDGATHTISKYYVVPSDFDLNKAANASEASNKFSKSMDQEVAVNELAATAEEHQSEFRIDSNSKGVNNKNIDIRVRPNEYSKNFVSVSSQLGSAQESASQDLGNLQVLPIATSHTNNVSNEYNITDTQETSINETQHLETNSDAQIETSILSNLTFTFKQSADRNLYSLWKLIKNYVYVVGKDEQSIRTQNLFDLLNVFTSLYKATLLNIPIEGPIDDIVYILRNKVYKNSTIITGRDGFQIEPIIHNDRETNNNVQEELNQDYIKPKKECPLKCRHKLPVDNVDSNSVSVSETDGQLTSNNVEKILQGSESKADNVNVWVKFPPNPSSKLSNVNDQLVNIQKSLLENPLTNLETDNTLKGVPSGYQILPSLVTPRQALIGQDKEVYEDTNLNLDILDTAEFNGQPLTIESKLKNVDFTIEDRHKKNQQYTIEHKPSDQPFTIENSLLNLPYSDTRISNIPFIIEDRHIKDVPFTIEDRGINQLFSIQNKISNIPGTLYSPNGLQLFNANPSLLTSSLNGFNVKNKFSKPHIYTYIINPTKFLYRSPDVTNNLLNVLSGKYQNNYEVENGYDYSATFGGGIDSKAVLYNKPSTSYYESELSLSNAKHPSLLLGKKPGFYESHVNIEREINLANYDNQAQVSSMIRPGVSPNYYDSNYEIEYEKETNVNPTILLPNSYESNLNIEIEKDNARPTIQEIGTDSEILLHNAPITTHESKLHIDFENDAINNFIGTATDFNTDTLQSNEPPNTYSAGINQEQERETNNNPAGLIPNIPTHESSFLSMVEQDPTPLSGFSAGKDVNAGAFLSNQPREPLVNYNKPNFVEYYQEKQQPGLNYVEHFKSQLAPSYQLFKTDNLLKLNDALIKRRLYNKLNGHEDKALTKLERINTILLILAEHFGNNGGNNLWYENIFFNVKQQKHPLQVYVYNLLRQKWLHEIMLQLTQNNFNLNIINDPRLILFLGKWQFPNNVLEYLYSLEFSQSQYAQPNTFEETFGAQNVLHENVGASPVLGEALNGQGIIQTDRFVDSFLPENEGLILSISGNAGLDANAIIDILKKYLVYRNYVENQENIINQGNKIEMFKQIVVFLREKGYDHRVIVDLIHRLYRAVYSIEGKCNRRQFNDFVQNAYEAIVPVLRRSGH